MGRGFRPGYEQRKDAFRLYGNHIVLILQDAFDGQETFAGQQKTVLVKKIGGNDRIGYPGFILQADKDESFGSAGTLASDDAASDAQALAAWNRAEVAGTANALSVEPGAAVGDGMRSASEARAVKIRYQALFIVHGFEGRRRIWHGQIFQ